MVALGGKVALITGAVRRIRRAMALALAAAGAAAVINTRHSSDEALTLAEEIEARGGAALVRLADVTDEAAVEAMVEAVIERFGRLDILINNAADRQQAPLVEVRELLGILAAGARFERLGSRSTEAS